MVRQFRKTRNARGEWSLTDLVRGYRICRYNHEAHGGTHIHVPPDGPIVDQVEIESESQGDAVMRAYAPLRDSFDLRIFEGVMTEWKSKSKSG